MSVARGAPEAWPSSQSSRVASIDPYTTGQDPRLGPSAGLVAADDVGSTNILLSTGAGLTPGTSGIPSGSWGPLASLAILLTMATQRNIKSSWL